MSYDFSVSNVRMDVTGSFANGASWNVIPPSGEEWVVKEVFSELWVGATAQVETPGLNVGISSGSANPFMLYVRGTYRYRSEWSLNVDPTMSLNIKNVGGAPNNIGYFAYARSGSGTYTKSNAYSSIAASAVVQVVPPTGEVWIVDGIMSSNDQHNTTEYCTPNTQLSYLSSSVAEADRSIVRDRTGGYIDRKRTRLMVDEEVYFAIANRHTLNSYDLGYSARLVESSSQRSQIQSIAASGIWYVYPPDDEMWGLYEVGSNDWGSSAPTGYPFCQIGTIHSSSIPVTSKEYAKIFCCDAGAAGGARPWQFDQATKATVSAVHPIIVENFNGSTSKYLSYSAQHLGSTASLALKEYYVSASASGTPAFVLQPPSGSTWLVTNIVCEQYAGFGLGIAQPHFDVYYTSSATPSKSYFKIYNNYPVYSRETRLVATNTNPLWFDETSGISGGNKTYVNYVDLTTSSMGIGINDVQSIAGNAYWRIQPPAGAVWHIHDYGASIPWVGNAGKEVPQIRIAVARSGDVAAFDSMSFLRDSGTTPTTDYPEFQVRPPNWFITNDINLVIQARASTRTISYSGIQLHDSASIEPNIFYVSASLNAGQTVDVGPANTASAYIITDYGVEHSTVNWGTNLVNYPILHIGTRESGSSTTTGRTYWSQSGRTNATSKKINFIGTKYNSIVLTNAAGSGTGHLCGLIGYIITGSF